MNCDKCGATDLSDGRFYVEDCSLVLCKKCAELHSSEFPDHEVLDMDAEEQVEDITEEEALKWLQTHEEDPQIQCARLFYSEEDIAAGAASSKWVTPDRARALRDVGFVVVDGFLPRDAATALRLQVEGLADGGD
eukprot:TRINITY_DN20025_c0_g1_i2.p1 TRINITY_DN20025_c0_g1~~TRINITY_DN20025_c0_g1_i2.p1  ORF type:complete len:135 (+),score=39.36 TRINITY_DN20025_c0_g1_i2:87-491(+)